MNEAMSISEVKIRLADEPTGGLIGWACCLLNENLLLDSIAIRRSLEGEIVLAFPRSKSKRGLEYPYYRPVTRAAYEQIRETIVSRLALLGKELPRAGMGE